ncbi:MAG: hypothetical protein IJ756_07460 [Paludibacteraceae bacterium]|nr:hypothetical protein [Paludibacteraceae bacterium]
MDKETLLIILGIVLVITLICYIIALIKSKRNEMVLTAGSWDMALLLTCPVLILIGSWLLEYPSYSPVGYVLLGISGTCFIGTIIFSIVYNKDSLWKIICSILAKVFIIWLTIFITMLLIALFIFYIILFFLRDRSENEGEYILLKYDKFLKAYVGYRI